MLIKLEFSASFGFVHKELNVFDGVCLCSCLCSIDLKRKYCARTEAEGHIWYEDRTSGGRKNKITQ